MGEQVEDQAEPEVEVATLLGAKGFSLSLACLRSLLLTSAESITFRIHSDGSLTHEHVAALRETLSHIDVCTPEQADEMVLPQLKLFPQCQRFRQAHILARKLFDIPLMAKDNVAYVDSDIFFLRKQSGLFQISNNVEARFFPDDRNAVRLPLSVIFKAGASIPAKLNSGMMLLKQGTLDLEYIEWVLEKASVLDGFFAHPWAEQSIWAALAGRLRTELYSPQQFAVVNPKLDFSKPWIGLHFVSSYRAMYESEEMRKACTPHGEVVSRVTTEPARYLGPVQLSVRLALEGLKRRM